MLLAVNKGNSSLNVNSGFPHLTNTLWCCVVSQVRAVQGCGGCEGQKIRLSTSSMCVATVLPIARKQLPA